VEAKTASSAYTDDYYLPEIITEGVSQQEQARLKN
jgi:hypothetical protein